MRLSKIKYRNLIIGLFCALSFFTVLLNAQEKTLTEEEKLFKQVEEGIANSSVDKFSSFFVNKIYISLATATPYNYSPSQAYYVMKNFLSVYNPIGFKFDFISRETQNPFAWGELKYIKSGMKGKAKVFVTLKNEKNQWKISHITIN